jgi:hypothetical protein
MLGLYVAVEISAVMDEFKNLEAVDENGLWRQSNNTSPVTLDDHVGAVFTFEIKDTIDTRPLRLGNVLPKSVIDLQNWPQSLCCVLQGNWL